SCRFARLTEPAPRFVKWRPGRAHQAHEQYPVIELVGRAANSSKAPQPRVETLPNAALDPSTGHQGRPQIRRVACGPRPRDVHLVRLDPIAFEVLEGTIAPHGDLVRERREFPPLAAGLPAAHQRVAPIEAAIACDVDVDALIDPRFREGNHRMPVTAQ